ncbi:MAG: zinc-dependent metalloprotease [Planctomycetota bacterium]
MNRSTFRSLALLFAALIFALPLLPAAQPGLYADDDKPAQPVDPVEKLLKGKKQLDGFQTIWFGDGEAYLELSGGKLDKPFLCMSSIGRGIATGGFVNGMTLADEVLYFEKGQGKSLRLMSRNVRFKRPDGPLQTAFDLSFHDSPIMVIEPAAQSGGRILVDLGDIFLTDFSGIRGSMRGLGLNRKGSYFSSVKVFEKNAELRANLLFQGGGGSGSPALADPRGVEIVMHYSLAKMPEAGYKPRMADNRVGYFTTVLYDFAQAKDRGFLRFINRWRLETAEPAVEGEAVAVKNPIVFWVENTVPYEYRPWVRAGLEAWNRAFEAAGYKNAIEVRQMPDGADWDPEDATKNTIRWTAAYNMGFAIGPSRVNPLTGEILDADILIDANFVRYFEQNYRLMTEATGAERPLGDRREILYDMAKSGQKMSRELVERRMSTQPEDDTVDIPGRLGIAPEVAVRSMCEAFQHKLRSVALAGVASSLQPDRLTAVDDKGLPKNFIGLALKELVMHEVGHTLGLRHNFRSSTLRTLDELRDRKLVEEKGFCTSVMDYMPVLVMADPKKQGYFNSPDIGPYDVWAIRYGYTPTDDKGIDKIASEAAQPEHIYGTDEDAYGAFGVDPYCRVWDMGREPLEYSQEMYTLVRNLWQQDWDKVAKSNPDDLVGVRRAFGTLMNEHRSSTFTALDFIGGVRGYRHNSTDPGAKNPIEPVTRAQMDIALKQITTESLGENAFSFPAAVLKKLAPSRWDSWGENASSALYVTVADQMLYERMVVLYTLHAAWVLDALNEIALMDPDALSPEQIYQSVTDAVWSSLGSGKAIPADRRSLQAEHLNLLMTIWTDSSFPTRGRLLARAMLKQIVTRLGSANVGNDAASKIHVEGMSELASSSLAAQPTRDGR